MSRACLQQDIMNIRNFAALAIAVHAFALTPAAGAEDLPHHIKFLAGLQSLFVLVDNSSKDAAKIKLTSEAVQRVVEQKLRLAGIKVLTAEENLRAVNGPFMAVSIGIRPRESILFGDITISLYQWGCLQRNAGACGGLITWQTSGIFTTKTKDSAQWLLGHIGDSMDIFLNDYFAANPTSLPIPTLPKKGK